LTGMIQVNEQEQIEKPERYLDSLSLIIIDTTPPG